MHFTFKPVLLAFLLALVSACGTSEATLLSPSSASSQADRSLSVTDTSPPGLCALDSAGDGTLDPADLANPVALSAADCGAQGGVILGGIPSGVISDGLVVGLRSGGGIRSVLYVPTPTILVDFANATGIPQRKYITDTHDCDDFADELEKKIESAGKGQGTFTVLFCGPLKENGNIDFKSPSFYGHAITDFHFASPTGGEAITWVDATGTEEGGAKAIKVNLDSNRDGLVSFANSRKGLGARPTESDGSSGCQVLVYEDRAAAEADLGPLD